MLTQFRNLTDDELIHHALGSVEATPLAVELAQRLDASGDDIATMNNDIDQLNKQIDELCDTIDQLRWDLEQAEGLLPEGATS